MMMICLFWCRLYSEDDGYGENTDKGFQKYLRYLKQAQQNTCTGQSHCVSTHTAIYGRQIYVPCMAKILGVLMSV